MLATIWDRLQEDPVHVLVLCGAAVGSVIFFSLVIRLVLLWPKLPAKWEVERTEEPAKT